MYIESLESLIFEHTTTIVIVHARLAAAYYDTTELLKLLYKVHFVYL